MSRPAEHEGTRDPAYLLYRAGVAVATTLPEQLLFPVAAAAGTLIARVNRPRRRVVARNLARVVPPGRLDACVDEAFRSYARYWLETLRIPKPGVAEIRRRTTVEGMDAMSAHIQSGQGAIFVTPHLGSWDIAGAWLASHGWRVVAIAEELRPAALYELFARLRREVGIEIHPLGKPSSARILLNVLRSGGVVGLIADRDISGTGVEVELFGEPTWLPAGPAVLALRTGAPLVAGAFYQRPGGRYHGVVLNPIPVEQARPDTDEIRRLMGLVARDFESLIRREPGQWHLFQPNWPSDPGYRRTSG